MKKITLVLLLISVWSAIPAAAQKFGQARIDSLLSALPATSADSAKADILNEVSWMYAEVIADYGKAIKYAHEARVIAERIQFRTGLARAYSRIGLAEWHLGNYQSAIENHTITLEISKELGFKRGIASSSINIGIIYYEQGNYPAALKNYYSALKISEEISDKYVSGVSYSQIGTIYQLQGNTVEAQKNFFASLKIFQEAGDDYDMAYSYSAIGNTYHDQHKHTEAFHYYNLGLNLHKKVGNNEGIATTYNSIGRLYSKEGNYPEALKNYFAALSIREKSGNKERISNSYNSIGICKLKMHNVREGKEWLMKALALAKEVGAVENMRESYENLAAADSALGDFKSVYEHHKHFIFFRDSLNNVEAARKNVQTKMQYDFEKKESVTKAEQDKKDAVQSITRNALIAGLILLFLLALILYNRFRLKKKANEIITYEKEKSDSLLLNILPAEVAEELKNKGSAEAKYFDNVTVLFTDFKSFTKVSEQLTPQELVDELHTCFKSFDEIITKYNIEKIKTIGDAYLAVCGLPLADEKHAENVVNAALEIREFMESRRQNLGEKTFEVRIGINSGSVVAGIVGVKKFAYDIWGDTVNTAARMEQNSEAGKINISQSTYELVKDKFSCNYRGEIDAKNKGMLKMYFVEGI